MNLDRVYEQSDPKTRTLTQVRAFGVYKDYDGNSPDGPVMLYASTKALARKVLEFLRDYENSDDRYEFLTKLLGKEPSHEFGLPHSDGHEWSAHWSLSEGWCDPDDVCETLRDAIGDLTMENW